MGDRDDAFSRVVVLEVDPHVGSAGDGGGRSIIFTLTLDPFGRGASSAHDD